MWDFCVNMSPESSSDELRMPFSAQRYGLGLQDSEISSKESSPLIGPNREDLQGGHLWLPNTSASPLAGPHVDEDAERGGTEAHRYPPSSSAARKPPTHHQAAYAFLFRRLNVFA